MKFLQILYFLFYVANQNPTVCVHTSAPFGAQNEDKTISEIEPGKWR